MRVSERMKSYNLLSDINRNMSRMLKTQQDLATGRRIHKPSDDPSGTTRLMQLEGQLRRTDRYEKNMDDARQMMLNSENAINRVIGLVQDADNMLIKASSDTLGADERQVLSHQMEELWRQSISLGNQEFAGKYLFGGTHNLTEPYTEVSSIQDETFTSAHDTAIQLGQVGLDTGSVSVTSADGAVTYAEGEAGVGDFSIDYEKGTLTVHATGAMADATDFLISYDTVEASDVALNPQGVGGEINRVLDEGEQMTINVAATEIFGENNEFMSTLRDAYNALVRDDTEAFNAIRDELSVHLDRASGILGEVGTKINRLDDQQIKLEADKLNYSRLISSIEDTDMAEALVQLERDQAVYEASLQTSARLIKNTLLDYL